jgi:uncharacterized low-complexity protein
MKKMNKTLVLAMGTTLMTGLSSVATAESVQTSANLFAMTELSSGYMQIATAEPAADANKPATNTKAPEAKCAGAKPMTEGKTTEAKCGDMHPKAGADQSGSTATTDAAKTKEGKCGEGKCGDAMKKTSPNSAAKEPAKK